MESQAKTESVRIDRDIVAQMREIAAREDRSLTGQLRLALKDWLARLGDPSAVAQNK